MQLIRLPNLLTVPGDPLAGALLTGAALDWRPPVASVCFYAAGLISNDLFDAAEDARDRPDRPIPSGRVSPAIAGIVAGALAAAGLALVPTVIGVALLAAILLYNAGGKRIPIFGPVNMGACRGLSLLLGATAFHPAAGLLALYIAVVTGIARHETTGRPVGWVRWLPALVLAAGFAFIHPTPVAILAVVVASVGGWSLSEGHASAWPRPGTDAQKRVPPVIGWWISALLPVQAAFCSNDPVFAVVLLALWLVFRVLSRKFYAS